MSSNDFIKEATHAEGDRYMANIIVLLVWGRVWDQRTPVYSNTLSAVKEFRSRGVVERVGRANMATPPWAEQVRW